jgi:HSP20 family protein
MDLKSLTPFGRREVMDPFTAMRREMDRMFEDLTRGSSLGLAASAFGGLPVRIDVVETEGGLHVQAELPGVERDDIEVQLDDGMLTLKGEKKREEERKEKDYHLVERAYGSFMRRIALPFEIDPDRVEAKFDKGVLTISLPRSAKAEAQPRRIEIKSDGR